MTIIYHLKKQALLRYIDMTTMRCQFQERHLLVCLIVGVIECCTPTPTHAHLHVTARGCMLCDLHVTACVCMLCVLIKRLASKCDRLVCSMRSSIFGFIRDLLVLYMRSAFICDNTVFTIYMFLIPNSVLLGLIVVLFMLDKLSVKFSILISFLVANVA